MESGVLNRGQVLQLLFESVDAYGENYEEEYAIQVTDNPVKQMAAKWITAYLIERDWYVMQLVARLAHLDRLHKLQSDCRHALAFGGVKREQREENIDAFEAGDIRLMLANVVFKKGVNIKRVDAALDMAEMKSKNDAMQKFGRLLRLHDEKHGSSLYIDFGTQKEETTKIVNGELERGTVAGRFNKAANSRARAFRAAGIPVKVVKVASVKEALLAVAKMVKLMEKKTDE
jgi:superfamily II DNA or RNA helicase